MDSYLFSNYNIVKHTGDLFWVANTISGAVVQLDERLYDIFCSNSIDKLSSQELDTLIANRIVVSSDLDEKGLLRAMYSKFKYSQKISQIIICPTLECNFACPYCFETRQQGKMSTEIQNETLLFIEKILEKHPQILSIDWFGGEPLLYPQIIEEMSQKIISLCSKYGSEYRFTITTNGYNINSSVLSLFERIRLFEARITLDGDAQTHNKRRILKNGLGTYDVIVKNIISLAEAGIFVKLRVNIDKDNPNGYQHIIDHFSGRKNIFTYPALVVEEDTQSMEQKQKCYSHTEAGYFYKSTYNEYQFRPAFEKLFSSGVCSCVAEQDLSYVIDQNGFLYKCVNDVGHKESSVGHVREGSPLNPSPIAKYMGRDPISEASCENCKFLPVCFGGCVYEKDKRGTHSCPQIKYIFDDLVLEKIKNQESHVHP